MVSKIFGAIFFLSLVGIVLVIFQGGATSAGQVVFTNDYRTSGSTQVLTFNNPTSLKVFQSSLQPGRPDYYAFKGSKDAVVQIKLDPLRLVGQDNFAPSLALFGPGLPPATPDVLQLFPFSLPAGNGLLVSAESTTISSTSQSTAGQTSVNPLIELPDRFDEPWTQTGYWERQGLLNQLPEDGTYYLAVYSLNRQSGKYALFVGDQPEAGLRETLTFPVTWARLHYWFDDLWWPTFALVLLGLAIAAVLFAAGRKVWWQYFRPMAYANRNVQRAALLTRKKRHNWQARRINRTPSRKQLSSNIIISRLLTQTGRRGSSSVDPSADAEHSFLQNGYSPEALPAPGNNQSARLEDQEQMALSPAQNGTDSDATGSAHEDGLSEWGKRFRP